MKNTESSIYDKGYDPIIQAGLVLAMLSFSILAAVSAGVAYFFSALSIAEIGPYKWIYFVLTFGYLVFLSILGFMKRIVDFAEREDWQAPRPRKK